MAGTILVADDSPTIQNKAKGILKGEGVEVVTVSNGVAAIKKLPMVKPQVILADVVMPGRDGYEVCDFVKKSPELRHVPVLLIFSDGDPYEEQRGAQVQADGRIKKPFDSRELIATVAKFLARAEALAPKPRTTQPIALAPPKPSFVTEPVDEEPELARKEAPPDLSAFSGGIGIGEPTPDAASSVPFEPIPSFEPMEASRVVEPEAPQPSAAPAESPPPAPEEPAPPPEPVLIEEQAAPPPLEGTVMFRMPTEIARQTLKDADAPARESVREEEETGRTMMFRMPTDIAQPVFTDETASAPPAEAPEYAPVSEEPADAPVSATTLESFSLTDAASGQVRFTAPETEVAAEPPAESEPSAEPAQSEAPAGTSGAAAPEAAAAVGPAPEEPVEPPPLDANFVYSIVQKVVIKMSPPALTAQQIHELAMKLTTDIIVELNQESSPN